MSTDLMFRIGGDSSAAERAATRAEMAMRKYQVAVKSARAEMESDFAKRTANERAIADRAAAAQEAAAQRTAAAYDKAGTVLLGVGAAAAAGLGLATKAAMDWESAFAGVAKTFPGGTEALADLEQGLRDLALVLPASHDEIAAVAAAAGALGVKAPAILGFTETMINLGEATDDLSAEEASTQFARFFNIMGTGADDIDRAAASLVYLGNNGASTEGEILALTLRLAAAGKAAGFTEADLMGVSSALVGVGVQAEAGGTAFSKVFRTMNDAVIDGGANLETFAQTAGVSTTEFSRMFREDAAGALSLFVDGLGEVSRTGGSTTATLDALGLSDERVSAALTGTSSQLGYLADNIEMANKGWQDGTALQQEVAKRYETTEAKVQLAKNALVDAGIEVGSQLLPVLATLANSLSDVLQWFSSLPGPVKTIVTGLAGLTAVGGLGAGAFFKIQSAAKRFLDTMDAAPGLLNATTKGFKALGALGVIGGIVGLAFAMHDLAGFTDDLNIDTARLATGFYVLAQSGKDTAGVADILGTSIEDLRDRLSGLDPADSYDEMNAFVQQLAATGTTLQTMVESGDIEQAAMLIDMLGLSADEAAKLFPGYAAAIEEAGARAADAADSTEDLTPAQKDLADQFGLTGQEARDAADDLSAMDDALHAIYETMFGGEEAQDAVAQGWIDLRDSITEMKDRYAEAMLVLSDPDATDEAKAAAQGLIDTYGTFTGTLTGNSVEALANRDAMREQIQSYLDQIDTLDRTALGTEGMTAKVQALKDEFIKNATEAGYAEDGVLDYAAAFDEVPVEVPTTITQPGMAQALTDTDAISDKLSALMGLEVATYVDVYYREWGRPGELEGTGISYPGGGRTGSQSAGDGSRTGSQSYSEQGSRTGSYSIPVGGPWGAGGYDGGRSGGSDRPVHVDARIINNNPWRRESAEDTMRNLARLSAVGVLDAAAGPNVVLAPLESQ